MRCCPWFDRLTVRINALRTIDLILSLSKDEARINQPVISVAICVVR